MPHYEQKELWDLLAAEMQIRTLAGFDAEAARKHGDRRITWVNPDILEETLGAEGGAGFQAGRES